VDYFVVEIIVWSFLGKKEKKLSDDSFVQSVEPQDAGIELKLYIFLRDVNYFKLN
jgi:hypothetical protein